MDANTLAGAGIVLGDYPERDDATDGRFEELLTDLVGRVRLPFSSPRSRFDRFFEQVQNHSTAVAALSDAEIHPFVTMLRYDITRSGLGNEEVARAFAVVREVAGRELGMRHFDVQMFGGWIMTNGMLAEMETGQGKTLTATLTASTAALAGLPVHVITSNDYLASRDAEEMSPVYRALGLSIGTVVDGMEVEERQQAYACDITYTTNKQVAFDYLKDRLVRTEAQNEIDHKLKKLERRRGEGSKLLMRGLCFALVDEADSVLIDEARTPLILSRKGDTSVLEATCRDALEIAGNLVVSNHYLINPRDQTTALTDSGIKRLEELTRSRGGVWSGKRRGKELVTQALNALYVFKKDKHYLVKDDKVQIVDENTGRVMPDRSWGQGLHQMVEAKENCELSGNNESLARTTYQRFFRRYLRVGGMSGTLNEVAGELWATYRLPVVKVPPNKPSRRLDLGERVLKNQPAKWAAVVARASALQREGRAILIGTRTVGESEQLSEVLSGSGVEHAVLNARQDAEEASIVSSAGASGQVTVATNMAGRGTDIKLTPESENTGGLHVIVAGCNDSRRVDRQLTGRCARQGNPGSFEYILSADDEPVPAEWPGWIQVFFARMANQRNEIPHGLGMFIVGRAQKAVERRHSRTRRALRRLEENLSSMLALSGRPE